MQTVTVMHKCDHCGQTSTSVNGDGNDLELHQVGVSVADPEGYCGRFVGNHQQWCRPCCEASGLLKPQTAKAGRPETPPEPPTIEAMLRMLARQEADAAAADVEDRIERHVHNHHR